MAFSGPTGDWKWKREEFGLPFHYSCRSICEACFAESGPGPYNFCNALMSAPWALTRRSLPDLLYAIADRDDDKPLTSMPGFHNQSFFEDVMHDDLLGLRPHACGAALKELADSGVYGTFDDIGPWEERLDAQLAVAYVKFCDWAGQKGMGHSHPKFTHLQLTLKRKTSEPILKTKAKNCVVVCAWIASEASEFKPGTYGEIRAMVLNAFVSLWDLLHATRFPNWELSDAQVASLKTIREELLLGYHWLSKENYGSGKAAYHCIPKFHKVDKMLRRAIRTKVSPTMFWTFLSESQMGITARLVNNLHGASSGRRGVQRWLLFFFDYLRDRMPSAP